MCTAANQATSSHNTKTPGCFLQNKNTIYCGNPPTYTKPHIGTTALRTGQCIGHRCQYRPSFHYWQHRQHSNVKCPQSGMSQSTTTHQSGDLSTRHHLTGPNPVQRLGKQKHGTATPSTPTPTGTAPRNGIGGRATGAPAGIGTAMQVEEEPGDGHERP